jgi:hypothetical protein
VLQPQRWASMMSLLTRFENSQQNPNSHPAKPSEHLRLRRRPLTIEPYVRAMRKFRYYCGNFWREYFVGAPGLLLVSGVHRASKPQIVNGIQVGDPTPETRECFLELMDQALALIANSDPLRWKRVQREIQIIINTPSIYTSSYGRTARVCMLDLRYFYRPDEPHLIVPLLTSELIYQATFGYLYSRGILRTRKNSQRFDRLRLQEAGRFLRRCTPLTDLAAASEIFEKPPQSQRWKRLPQELCAALTSEPAAQATLWKSVLRRVKESQ